jgi:hypothetical protein
MPYICALVTARGILWIYIEVSYDAIQQAHLRYHQFPVSQITGAKLCPHHVCWAQKRVTHLYPN